MGRLFLMNVLFLFFLLFSSSGKVFGTGSDNHHGFRMDSLLPKRNCSTPKGSNPKGLKIVQRNGPCSPFGRQRATLRQLLRQDQARVDWLRARISGDSQGVRAQDASIPAQLGSSYGTLNYIVTVGFGTPETNQSVGFDTGSDLTWIQCNPCPKCYTQKDPVYDPTQSKSYHNVACDSTECNGLKSATGNPPTCSSSTCQYAIGYGDGSTSEGSLARDALTLTPSDVIQDFLFGCGNNDNGLFGSTSGILGLGQDPISIVSQTATKYNQLFSYCLPSSSSSTGYLKFGSDATASSTVKFTPLVKNSNLQSFYFLEMTGIRVAGEDLQIPPSTFSSPGTIIDSGTVITRLPPAAYTALRSAFRDAMSNYTMGESYEIFDTCYDFSGQDYVTVPKIALRFGGNVDMDLDISGIFYVESEKQVCLAFAGNRNADSLTIVGNKQQRTFEVVYDVGGGKVGFGAGGCD